MFKIYVCFLRKRPVLNAEVKEKINKFISKINKNKQKQILIKTKSNRHLQLIF